MNALRPVVLPRRRFTAARQHWLLGACVLLGCGHDRIVFLGRDQPAHETDTDTGAAGSEPPMQPVMQPPLEPVDAGTVTQQAGGPAVPPPPPSCAAGVGDCDGDAANGCEVDLLRSAEHCGACNVACNHADCVCEDGARVLRCPAGRMDCNMKIDDGCETDVSADDANCGACGHTCSPPGPNAVEVSCSAGQCVLTCASSAIAPFGDCDGNPDNGCEAALWADPNNCGECGTPSCTFCEDGNCL